MKAIIYGTASSFINELRKEKGLKLIHWFEGNNAEFLKQLNECNKIYCLVNEVNFGKQTIHPRLSLIKRNFKEEMLIYLNKKGLEQIIESQ